MDNLQIELQIIYLTKLFLDLNMKLFLSLQIYAIVFE
ncbi:hypothetical protein HMPREF9447_00306 [Bacteroides oleiciplenus YIT 12058]|uniref:Uncharacterized protein n=1 Tax=Bacteroides oleiciplenus YIT 12058 TaxID=742727 RepID=K9E641_9BACE|nr:hypothetical protein HMPREF9447_00306 [Bacteroides oleiciplenus YIT 12058]